MINKRFNDHIDSIISNYDNGVIKIAGDIEFSMAKDISQYTHYILSKYTDDGVDANGNPYRFRNVGNAIVDLEFRAKNLDRKNIQYTATDGDYVFSMIVNKEVQQFMKDENWGQFIDDFQRKKTEYGSVLVKNTAGQIDIANWNYIKANPRDIIGGEIIEEHELSPLELKRKGWKNTDDVLLAHKKVKDIWEDIKVLDIDGEFPKEYFDENDDTGETVLKNVILAVVSGEKFLLHEQDLSELRYKYFTRKKVEGRDWGIGVWEEVREPQIAINEAVIEESEARTLSGKVVLKTNKKGLPDASAIVNGEMVYLEDNEYLDTLNLMPSGGLQQYQSSIDNWFLNLQRDQSAFNAMTGEEVKAGTPFAGQALQASQAGSIFNKRRDQDGFNIREILVD